MANPNIPAIIKLDVIFIVGAIMHHAGDAAAQAKKAQEVIDVCSALTLLNQGDTTAGLDALQTAFNANSEDPAKAQAIQTAIEWIATKASSVQQFLSGTLLGTINAELATAALTEATTLAQKYIKPAQ